MYFHVKLLEFRAILFKGGIVHFSAKPFMAGLGQCSNCKTLHLENLLKNVRNLPMHTRKYLLFYEEESVFNLTDCFVLF